MRPLIALIATDSGIAAVFGIGWTILLIAAGTAALFALIYCPFSSKADRVLRFSSVAIFAGCGAAAIAILATFLVEPNDGVDKKSLGYFAYIIYSIKFAAKSAIPAGVAVVARYFSQRMARKTVHSSSGPSA